VLRKKRATLELEPDVLTTASCNQADPGPLVVPNGLAEDDSERLARWFPNSLKIPGIKHICDNLLSSTLQSLPQLLSQCV